MKVVIIGNGISGITAARHIRKLSDHHITVVSDETDYFFSRTALMYIYMGHMRQIDTRPYESHFWVKNNIHLLKDRVIEVDFHNKKLHLKNERHHLDYDKLIIATGSSPNKFGWKGQDLEGVRGLYHLQDLEYIEKHSKNLQRAVIVGGGLIGIELAEMFASRNIPVTFLVREKSYWSNVLPKEESAMINKHILEHHIDLKLGTELQEIIDNGQGKAEAVMTNKGEKIPCGFVGLTAGVHPNIGFIKNTPLETQKGIIVNNLLETNITDVYAIGDCAQLQDPNPGRRPIEAVWYTGRMMGETVAYNICGKSVQYNPGIWFNSAKFFDIEYQVYGDVQAHPPENHESIYWEDSNHKKSIRIVYDKNTNQVLGFNLMGIRYRHELCEKWIKEKATLSEVIQNLGAANFDPEFYKQYEQELASIYNNKFPKEKISLQKRRGFNAFLSLFKN